MPVALGQLLAQAVATGLVMAVGLVALSPLLKIYFRVPFLTPVVMIGLWVVPTAIAIVPRGVLLGELR